jgi:hypothetical protein
MSTFHVFKSVPEMDIILCRPLRLAIIKLLNSYATGKLFCHFVSKVSWFSFALNG